MMAEIKQLSDRNHMKQLENGYLQKEIIELKQQLFKMEQNLLIAHNSTSHLKELNGLNNKELTSERKFIESFLHMVDSCQPERDKPLTLKQSWRWLKTIL
jgi:hypothetical protein